MEGFQVLHQEWTASNSYWNRAWSNCSSNNFQATNTAILTADKEIITMNPQTEKIEEKLKSLSRGNYEYLFSLLFFFTILAFFVCLFNFRLYYKKDVKPFFFLVLPPFLHCKVGKKYHLNHKESRWITTQEPWEKSPTMNCLLTTEF